ncbi:MAG: phosphopantothenoylcysteine decarboxylase [Planctomycetota bacterium]
MTKRRAATAPKGRRTSARVVARTATRTGGRRPLHVVVTAGPTREHIDPVRYLTNESSGRMGFAIAAAAAERGHRVTLIAGPVHLETPAGVERVDVESARDMLAATSKATRTADALFMAAAVCDWRPAKKLAGKWRKKDGGTQVARLDLVRNPDILATVARAMARPPPRSERGARRLVVGFALETGDGIRRARRKLHQKGADFIVLNDASALNARRTSVLILGGDSSCRRLQNCTKETVAEALVELLARIPS